jgi:flagellar biosynthesis protein FliR
VFIALLFVKEALLGFILGFFASMIFYAYELVGELIDISRAASMSRLLVPELKHQSSAMGTLLFQLSLVVFIGLGFHRHSIQIAYESFIAFPVLSLDLSIAKPDFLSYGAYVVAHLFDAAMRFALPVIVVSLLIDLAFGLMNRVAPQINAYFLSLPAKMIGGLIIIALVLPFLMDDFSTHYQSLSRFFRFFVQAQ